MNIYLLLVDFILASAVIYLLVTHRRGGSHFSTFGKESVAAESVLMDSVTQLYNRRYLLQRLQESMAKSEREKKSLAVVLWDIEGFSDFNNEFGQEGDRLLQKVAGVIKKSVRVYDEVFRSGDDEFCAILLPGDAEVAQEVTRRVSELVHKQLFEGEAEYSERQFSLPSGAVFYPGEPNQSVESLLYAAKQALYKAKLVHTSLN